MPLAAQRKEEKSNLVPPLFRMVNQLRLRVETKRMKRERKVKRERQKAA
jgi:hypothetical protein